MYAETARLIHFGKVKTKKSKKDGTHCQFLIDSIAINLHRDDWWENLDEEKATLLCYDICEFSIKELEMVLTKEANGNQTISVALSDLKFTGKSALVLFYHVISCVQYKVLTTWLFNLTLVCLY